MRAPYDGAGTVLSSNIIFQHSVKIRSFTNNILASAGFEIKNFRDKSTKKSIIANLMKAKIKSFLADSNC